MEKNVQILLFSFNILAAKKLRLCISFKCTKNFYIKHKYCFCLKGFIDECSAEVGSTAKRYFHYDITNKFLIQI